MSTTSGIGALGLAGEDDVRIGTAPDFRFLALRVRPANMKLRRTPRARSRALRACRRAALRQGQAGQGSSLRLFQILGWLQPRLRHLTQGDCRPTHHYEVRTDLTEHYKAWSRGRYGFSSLRCVDWGAVAGCRVG
jgi:hypothetical protein